MIYIPVTHIDGKLRIVKCSLSRYIIASTIAFMVNSYNGVPLTEGDIIDDDTTYLVYIDNNKIVGCIGLSKKECAVLIKHFSIMPRFRNMGIGKTLLNLVSSINMPKMAYIHYQNFVSLYIFFCAGFKLKRIYGNMLVVEKN